MKTDTLAHFHSWSVIQMDGKRGGAGKGGEVDPGGKMERKGFFFKSRERCLSQTSNIICNLCTN